jgi:hypothetical protein
VHAIKSIHSLLLSSLVNQSINLGYWDDSRSSIFKKTLRKLLVMWRTSLKWGKEATKTPQFVHTLSLYYSPHNHHQTSTQTHLRHIGSRRRKTEKTFVPRHPSTCCAIGEWANQHNYVHVPQCKDPAFQKAILAQKPKPHNIRRSDLLCHLLAAVLCGLQLNTLTSG